MRVPYGTDRGQGHGGQIGRTARSRWSRRGALGVIACTAFAPGFIPLTAHAADDALTLVITYRVSPPNRVAFRREIADDVTARLRRAQQEGRVASYRLLASRYVESGDWDVLALLSFASPAQLRRWRAVEAAAPAALGPRALELVSAVETVPVELLRQGGAPDREDAPPSVLLVIPYEYTIAVGEYVKYFDGYTVPQLEGWLRQGVLARYAMYLCRYPAGRPWNALLFLEYAGEEGLAQREAVVAKVRAELQSVPAWKAWSENKSRIRNEKQVVVADDFGRQFAD